MTAKGTDLTNRSPNGPLYHDLLVTAQINILNNRAQPIWARALLDTGSSMNLMTEEFANSLSIKQRKCAVPIGALDNLTTIAKRHITANLTSTDGAYERTLTFLVIPTISTLIRSEPIDCSTFEIPRNLKLADPRFHVPAPIDVLLSSGSIFARRAWTASAKNAIWLGNRGESYFAGRDQHISRNHDRYTSGSRPLLVNGRGTIHPTFIGIRTTMWGAFPKPCPTHQGRAIDRRPAIQWEVSFIWDVEVRCYEQARLSSLPIPTRQTIWNRV